MTYQHCEKCTAGFWRESDQTWKKLCLDCWKESKRPTFTESSFTQSSPGAVRCADCQHSPGRHKATCQITRKAIHGLGYWRKCNQYAYGPQPLQPKPKRVTCRTCQHRPRPVKNPCQPAGVYMTITGIDKRRYCNHWQSHIPMYRPPEPEIRYVAKEHVEAALANNPGANVIQFRPRGGA